jgi:NADPH:quinone reductase-like Zn-dependent oxidoreductase
MAGKNSASRGHMKAIVYRRFGSPDVLEIAEVERPAPGDDQVLVRIRAVGLNPYDWHFLRGEPLLFRPMMGVGVRKPRRPTILGSDIAGVVESVGTDVTRFRPGDEVYGTKGPGACAEYAVIAERALALKPAGVTFEEAAAVPMAGLTALQGMRDFGRLESGQKVLVNGASGGVGTFAVQIARALGAAEVTGVCSTGNVELVRSIGADHVIDYTRQDFTRSDVRHDLVVDTVGNRSLRALMRALTPKGTLVLVGGGGGRLLGPMGQMIRAKLMSPFVSQGLVSMLATVKAQDLDRMRGFMEAGTVKSIVDRTYPLAEAAAAMRYLEQHHARGKVVITV